MFYAGDHVLISDWEDDLQTVLIFIQHNKTVWNENISIGMWSSDI